MLEEIIIKGLFNQFDYHIKLKSNDITILTGPNGYGKTTILKIIYAIATKNLSIFFKLNFKEIFLKFKNDSIKILKNSKDTISIKSNNDKAIELKNNEIIPKEMKRWLENTYYRQIDENLWIDRRTEIAYPTENLIDLYIENFPEKNIKYSHKSLPDLMDVYLIREQRLLRKKTYNRNNNSFFINDESNLNFTNTIEEYAKELSRNLKDSLAKASKIGQELDSTFPQRLFEENETITECIFNERFNAIKEKQNALSTYGLSASLKDNHTSFKNENAKPLLVYLNDTEKKLAVFDELYEKLNLFSDILNERRFAFKKMEISPENGLKFVSEHNEPLALTDLSSGEQQEIVLLYELLFRVKPNTLVMIDEPEISLHVAWQKDFLNDLMKIIKLQKITVITATHSPQIINNNWDLTIDLYDLAKEKMA